MSKFPSPFFIILLVVLFAALLTGRSRPEVIKYQAAIDIVLFTLNVVVFGAWFLWGLMGGGIFAVVCSAACFVAALTTGNSHYMRWIFLFAGTGLFCYGLLEKEEKSEHRLKVILEETRENENTLRFGHEKNKLTGEALHSMIDRYLLLREIAQELTSSLDFEKTVQLIVRRTLEVIDKKGICLIYLAEVEGQRLALKASWRAKVKTKAGDEFDEWVLKHGQVLLVENVEKDFRFRLGDGESKARKVESLISAPLVSGERIIGILRVDSETANTFITNDLRSLRVLAMLAAVSIENAQLYRRTEELAITDGLTGLYVHRHFQERLGEELRRAARNHSPLSFLMIDIDHFKKYNDRYGHSVGDIVLKRTANILKKNAGEGSITARYGGEEFAIILPMVEKNAACRIAESIRMAIFEKTITVRREKTHIAVSIGVAAFPVDAVVKEEIIKLADDALLKAKRAGRNRVEVG